MRNLYEKFGIAISLKIIVQTKSAQAGTTELRRS